MWGRWLSSSSRGCHGRDRFWEAIRIIMGRESPLFSGGSWGWWELEGMRTLDLSRPKIWRGRRPPKLCRPGRVKCKLESPCSVPRVANMFTRGSLRQRTTWVRFPEEDAHSVGLGLFRRDRATVVKFLAPGRWLGMSRILNWSRSIWATAVLLSQ